MTKEQTTDLSNFLNSQANLPTKIQAIADMLKEVENAPTPSEVSNGSGK